MSQGSELSGASAAAWRAVVSAPGDTLLALDFDGTLAPIVDDPEQAYASPDAIAALARLGPRLRVVVLITGRPVRTAVRLGGLAGRAGLENMVVIGQYGFERWNAAGNTYAIPPEPPEIVAVDHELPTILRALGLTQARVEHKGRAVVVHTRTMAAPAEAYQRLADPLRELAARHGLAIEPGKNVWEIRPAGMDKGEALESIVAETGARQVIFAGDDLGDLPAFEAVARLREQGLSGLLVCSASQEEDALAALADVVVEGPTGVAAWLNRLADALEG